MLELSLILVIPLLVFIIVAVFMTRKKNQAGFRARYLQRRQRHPEEPINPDFQFDRPPGEGDEPK